MNPKQFGRLSMVGLLTCLVLCARVRADAEPSRPNVVFILADDLGWRDLSCYGSPFYETPNLDALAKQGMKFTSAYAACCVCSPTRASILTGKSPARLHLTDWLPGRPDLPSQKLLRPEILQHLPLSEFSIARAFHEGGYATACIGKWHLGGPGFYPQDQGFDLNVGGCALGHPPSYFSPYHNPTLPDGPPGEYLTDRLTDEAIKFIGAHKDRPFLLYLAHYAVHNPQQAKPGLLGHFKAKAVDLRRKAGAGPEFLDDSGVRVRQIQDRPVYAAMIASLDDSVGRVLAELDADGLAKNTIVIFTSDNGGLSTAEGTPTSNLPLRMGKGWNYEGGIREPMIVRWPGVVAPGSVCKAPTISTDDYPTLLEATGLPPRPAQCLDGVSVVPLLKGAAMAERALYWHYPHYSNQGGKPGGAIRAGRYKLIEQYEDGKVELYDLDADPGEQRDLAGSMPEKAADLRRRLHDWRSAVGAQMPTPNPNYRPPASVQRRAAADRDGARIAAGLGPLDDD